MWEPWDSSDVSTESTETSRSSLEAATEAAARINALLVAKGVLKPSQLSTATTKSTKSSILPAEVRTFYCKLPQWATSQNGNVIIAEVDINNVTLTCRNILTRSSTLEEIAKLTGVTISSRGRFISDEAKVEPGDRPLYLHLQSSSQEAIDNAVTRIQKIIDGKDRFIEGSRFNSSCVSSPVQSKPSTSRASSSMAFLEDKLFIGLEHAPPSFDVRGKILGPECSYLQHIQTETGARVLLRGRNSGYFEPDTGREACEPMNIFLEHPATSGLQKAKELAKNLIEMVQEDYVEFQQSLATMLPPPSSAIAQSTATLLAGLQPHSVGTPVGLALVGTSMPSSLSVMPMAAAITAPSPLGFAIGPPVFNPGPTVLLDTSIPPPCVAGSHATSLTLGVMPSSMSSFMVDQTVPPPLGQPIVSLAGSGMMSVQPATSFVLTQPANQPPPGSLVLTQQPSALASGPIVLSQPVSGNPDSYVITPSGQAPNAIVLSHPAGPQIGQFVHQQLVIPAGAQIAVESTPCSVVTNELSHGQPPLALQTAPVFSQAGGRHVMKPFSQFMLQGQTVSCSNNEMRAPPPVSVVQIASGSQLTMVQPSPSSESSVGGPSAIYTVTVPVSAPVSSQSENCETATAASCDASNRDSRKRRFTETEDDFSNLLGYQHGPTHLVNTFVVSSAGTVTSTSTSKDANDSQQAVADAHSVRSSWDRQPVETSFSHIRLSSHGTPLNADEGVQNAVSQSSEVFSEVPVTQYSGQPQLYNLSAALQSQPKDVGLHLLPQDLAVTIYTSSQPASYIYQQTNTVTYRRLYQPSDTLSSYCAPVLSTSQPSTVFIQDSSLPPPTHYVIPPPPSIVSSVGPQTFTASAALATQFSYAQPLASAGYEVQPPPVYQQSTAYSGFPVSGISHHSETAYSQMSRIPPPPPPPPSNSTAVSYWMSLS